MIRIQRSDIGAAVEFTRKIHFVADKQRKFICILLGGEPANSALVLDRSTATESSYDHHFSNRSSETSEIILSAPIAAFPVQSMRKTIARLSREGSFPPVDAMSGWGHHSEQDVTISGKDWTSRVFEICDIIGHSLSPELELDQGRPGRYLACHAEKKLVAYFVAHIIAHHAFLENEILSEKEIENHKRNYEKETANRLLRGEISDDNSWWEQMEQTEQRNLRNLYLARPPVSLREATILVSTAVCEDCEEFVRKVEFTFEL